MPSLSLASLRFASLRFASLRFASLRFASLRFASLRFASLVLASLRSCSLRSCSLRSFSLLSPPSNTRFARADLAAAAHSFPTILDIAGGKGDLSWLLCNADSLRCVTIDPRPSDHKSLNSLAYYCHENPAIAVKRAEGVIAGVGQGMGMLNLGPGPYVTPSRIRMFFDAALVAELVAGEDFSTFFDHASTRADMDEAKSSRDPSVAAPTISDAGRVTSAVASQAILLNAALIVAFHPDSATEPAIDYALERAIPFAVVPCCVFPSLFEERRYQGRKVSGYESFVGYLMEKDARMREATLEFGDDADKSTGARNKVLYMTREDFERPQGLI